MNYTLIAKLDHTPNGNFVTSFEEEDHFEKYNTMDSWCEHCKKRIYRKTSYIFRDENGNEVQVGTSCINHYLGEEPSMEEEIILRSSHSDFAAGLDSGFFSYGNRSGYSTRAIALAYISTNSNPKDRDFKPLEWYKDNCRAISKKASAIYEEVEAFFSTFEPKTGFENNVKMAVLNGYADNPSFAKWAYKIYADMKVYSSNPSTKLESEVFTIREIWIESEGMDYRYDYRGTPYKTYRMYTTNGNLVEFKTTSQKDFLAMAGKVVKASIKSSFSSRKGEVTIINRLALN